MTTLVLQAHPVEDSYNCAIFDAVLAELDKDGQPFATVRIGNGDKLDASEFALVTRLIAIYPTWYGSLPAVFLDSLSRLLSPWADNEEPTATSPFRSVESLKVITSHGSSKLINVLQGEPGLQLWKRTVLPLCAPGATFAWKALYKLDRADAASRARFITQAADFARA